MIHSGRKVGGQEDTTVRVIETNKHVQSESNRTDSYFDTILVAFELDIQGEIVFAANDGAKLLVCRDKKRMLYMRCCVYE